MQTTNMPKQWYFGEREDPSGPYTIAEFRQLIRDGHITAESPVYREGMANWTVAGNVMSLFNARGEAVRGVIAGMPEQQAPVDPDRRLSERERRVPSQPQPEAESTAPPTSAANAPGRPAAPATAPPASRSPVSSPRPRPRPSAARRPLSPSERSSIPLVLGILHILGGLLFVLLGLAQFGNTEGNDMFGTQVENLIMIEHVVGILLAAASLIVGIGLVCFSEWGRRGTMIVSGVKLGFLLIDSVIGVPMVLNALDGMAMPDGQRQAVRTGAIIGITINIVIALPLPIVSLVLLSRPRVRFACGGQEPRHEEREEESFTYHGDDDDPWRTPERG